MNMAPTNKMSRKRPCVSDGNGIASGSGSQDSKRHRPLTPDTPPLSPEEQSCLNKAYNGLRGVLSIVTSGPAGASDVNANASKTSHIESVHASPSEEQIRAAIYPPVHDLYEEKERYKALSEGYQRDIEIANQDHARENAATTQDHQRETSQLNAEIAALKEQRDIAIERFNMLSAWGTGIVDLFKFPHFNTLINSGNY